MANKLQKIILHFKISNKTVSPLKYCVRSALDQHITLSLVLYYPKLVAVLIFMGSRLKIVGPKNKIEFFLTHK